MSTEATKDVCKLLAKHDTSALHTGVVVVEVVAIEDVVLELDIVVVEDVMLELEVVEVNDVVLGP